MFKVKFILIFVSLLLFGVALYFSLDGNQRDTTSRGKSNNLTQAAYEVPPGKREYRNNKFHFLLHYPEELTVKEFNDKGEALTVSFENKESGEGFQIFVVSYAESQVTPERFKLDVPSGVRESPTQVLIDGVTGEVFFSENGTLGKTREVWFIRGGYLYEVTTYRELDAWLAEIMHSWKFI